MSSSLLQPFCSSKMLIIVIVDSPHSAVISTFFARGMKLCCVYTYRNDSWFKLEVSSMRQGMVYVSGICAFVSARRSFLVEGIFGSGDHGYFLSWVMPVWSARKMISTSTEASSCRVVPGPR